VVDPGREEDTRRDLEFDIGRGQVVLTDAARTVWEWRWRVEEHVEVRRPADGGRLGADHRGVTDRDLDVVLRRTVLRGAGMVVGAGRRRLGFECELTDERSSGQRSRGSQQLSSCEPYFSHG